MKFLSNKLLLLICGIVILLCLNGFLLFSFFATRNADSEIALQTKQSPTPGFTKLHRYDKSENEDDYIQSQMSVCAASNGHDNCYQQIATNLLASFPLSTSLDIIAENETSNTVYERCHELTHFLGRQTYATSQDLPSTLVSCNSTCQGGCYHGAVEQYLKEHDHNLSGNALKATFTSICQSKSLTPLIFAECEHGLGHAAMLITDSELTPSLSLCDLLPARENKEHCYSGVFMEYSSSSTENNAANKNMHPADPLYPCDTLSSQYLPLCYQYQSSYFSIITHYDAKATADLCMKVPKEYQKGCIQIIGGGQVGLTRDVSVMSRNCTQMPTADLRQTCNQGVVSSLATRYVGQINKLASYCAIVTKDDQQRCFGAIGRAVTLWSNKNTNKNYCEELTGKDKKW